MQEEPIIIKTNNSFEAIDFKEFDDNDSLFKIPDFDSKKMNLKLINLKNYYS